MTEYKTRHVEIAGGGFAGLVAAITFRRLGWSVTLHEKSDELRPVGAGIFLWENGLRILEQCGILDEVLADSVTPPFYETRIHDLVASKEMFGGARWRTMARKTLHGALAKKAAELGAEILTNSEVVSASSEGSVTLASGKVRYADLVVGADGVGSQVRDSLGFEFERTFSRDGIARVLVERDRELTGPEWDNVIDMWHFAPRVMRILYVPCNERYLYLGLMAPVEDEEASRIPLALEAWAETFPRLLPALTRVANMPYVRRDQYQTNILKEWTRGRVALIGDSAHAMCPALAQGAGTSMVNAYTLAHLVDKADDIAAILPKWEAHVRGITDRCQSRSAHYAATRAMARGYQFTAEVMETANTNPVALANF
jgi:2-methyl-3-hydroxypyridine 5-carboxylic acid dioxygenase